jgi:DNA-binding transcriptional ArsR family regulator
MAARPRPEPTANDKVVKAIAHPLRQRILRLLNQRVTSPSDLAKELGESLPNVSYHMRILLAYDCIELVRTEQRRGAVEHYYRATTRPMMEQDHWRGLPGSIRRQLLGQTLEQVLEHVGRAATENRFDHPDAHVSWTTFELDGTGWSEMSALVAETLERATAIAAESAVRMLARDGDEPGSRTELAILHFERGAPDGRDGASR